MERSTVVVGVHAVVALGLLAFGAYRISLGGTVPGALNVLMSVAVFGVGIYMGRLS